MPILDGDGNPVPGAGGSGNSGSTTTSSIANIKKQLIPSNYDGVRYYSSANMKPSWIVIHNVGPGSAQACYNTFTDPGGRNVSTHFTCDDKEIIQMLEVSWKGIHTNGNAMSKGGCSEWANSKAPATPCDANNSNSIGIEVGNNGGGVTSVDEAKALEVAIELTRYLMKELNIDVNHVVRHGDTQPKNCPSSIMAGDGSNWLYFKEQITKRNQENKPIELNTSNISVQPGNNMGGPGSSAPITQLGSYGGGVTLLDTPLYAAPTDIEVQLPDVDHRENITNMDEVTGVSLIFYPPYNSCEAENRENHFTELKYDRTYHYVIGKGYESQTPEGGDVARSVFNMRNKDSKNRAYIYNVADGLCVFIRNDGTNILVDCGEKNEAVKKGVLDHISALGVNTIHHVILTHFHSDHVAGFKDFANKFTIENVYYKDLDKSKLAEIELSDTWRTDKYYDEVLNICKEKQINQTKITADKTVSCVKIFAGDTSDNYSNYNRQSLSMIVTMNDKKLFIGGDIIESTEKLILPKLSKCDAMIIAHHGYAGSNCQEILDKIDATSYPSELNNCSEVKL
jgi:beta-lactamase superfamily II metal-dependent hydrolase/N-acetyl-anhydromuramyl-L-alanine amidase AmpD